MRLRNILVLTAILVVIGYYVVTAFVLQPQSINKQSFYVRLQSDWASYPGNILYDVTNVWTREGNEHLDPQARLDLSKQANRVQEIHGKSYVLVHHGNSNCYDDWEPHYARFGVDTVRHHVEYVMGLQKSTDPNLVMYNSVPGKQDADDHEAQIKSGYVQFIPICTHKEKTTFDYSIKINDETIGFDAYFVPSVGEQDLYVQNSPAFKHYEGCFTRNHVRFSGTCHDVGRESGLLIILPDNLGLPLTKVEVWLYEK